MVLLLFQGNTLSNPFSQGRCIYVKTLIAAIHYIKRSVVTLRTFERHFVYLKKAIAALIF